MGEKFFWFWKRVRLYLISSKPDVILFGDLKIKLVGLPSFYHQHFGEKYGWPSPPNVQEIEMEQGKQKWFSDGFPKEISGFEMKLLK